MGDIGKFIVSPTWWGQGDKKRIEKEARMADQPGHVQRKMTRQQIKDKKARDSAKTVVNQDAMYS